MAFTSLPPEVLYMILDDESLDKSDWKSLRLVHSDLATNIAPLLFSTVSFEFRRNGDQGFNDVLTRAATARLLELSNPNKPRELSSTRNISYFARRFRISFKNEPNPSTAAGAANRSFSGFLQNTNGIAQFITAFENLYPTLLRVFSNVRGIDVNVSSLCLRKHHARTVFSTICRAGNVEGRSLSVTLTGVSFGSEAILDSISNAESFALRIGRSSSGRELDARHVAGVLMRSPRLSSLSVNDQLPFSEIVDQLPNGLTIPSLRSLEVVSSKSQQDIDRRPKFYVSEDHLRRFPCLEDLRLDSYAPIPPKQATWFSGITVWHSLAALPDTRLRSLHSRQLDIGMLSYLSSPDACSRVEDLSITFDACQSLPAINSRGVVEDVRYGPQQWKQFGQLLYNAVVPNISSSVRRLVIAHKDLSSTEVSNKVASPGSVNDNIKKEDSENQPQTDHVHSAVSSKTHSALADVGSYVSFPATGSRRNYSFPKLESLHAVVVLTQDSEDGSFGDFMGAIRNAPVLRDVKLTVVVTNGYAGLAGDKPADADIMSEVNEYTCWDSKWKNPVGLELEVVDMRSETSGFSTTTTKNFVFQGQKWAKIGA